jgi:hypothetical protein
MKLKAAWRLFTKARTFRRRLLAAKFRLNLQENICDGSNKKAIAKWKRNVKRLDKLDTEIWHLQ